MKTETEIAKQLSETYKKEKEEAFRFYYCENHKLTCERWLEFLEKMFSNRATGFNCIRCDKFFKEKITDLTQAIKEYEEVGI